MENEEYKLAYSDEDMESIKKDDYTRYTPFGSSDENKVFADIKSAIKEQGTKWGYISPVVEITKEDLNTLLNGGVLTIDVFDEYKVFLGLRVKDSEK